MIRIVYLLPIIGALLGGFTLLLTFTSSQGAPQEAAGAAIACALALLPYVLARSVQMLFEGGLQTRNTDRLVTAIDAAAQRAAYERRP